MKGSHFDSQFRWRPGSRPPQKVSRLRIKVSIFSNRLRQSQQNAVESLRMQPIAAHRAQLSAFISILYEKMRK